jgi:hypothetical protein
MDSDELGLVVTLDERLTPTLVCGVSLRSPTMIW